MTDLDALARRAVACKGWRWLPGMLICGGSRIYDMVDDDCCHGDVDCHEWANEHGWGVNRCDYHIGRPLADTSSGHLWLDSALPDLTDPAMLGCLLALVREAYGDQRLACVPWRRGWAIDRVWLRSGRLSIAITEAEALVSALEDAP